MDLENRAFTTGNCAFTVMISGTTFANPAFAGSRFKLRQFPIFSLLTTEDAPLQAQADAVNSVFDVPLVGNSAAADQELQRRISNFLLTRRLPQSSNLRIDAKNGVVTLQGTHRSFYHKQLCIHCCQRVAGVVRLIDATRVLPER